MKLQILTIILCSLSIWADEKTFEVKEDSIYLEKKYKSYVSSSQIQKVKIDAKQWTVWKVEEAVEHGAEVKADSVLLKFDKQKYLDTVEKRQRDLRLQELNLNKQKLTAEQTEYYAKRELELAKLNSEIATKAELIYNTTGRKKFIENLENDVLDMEKNLKYQMSELDQLQKMYTQDSLKEESEEIVLQRQKDTIERAKRYVEARKKLRDDALALKLPLTDFNTAYNKEKAEKAIAKSKLEFDAKVLTEQNKLKDAENILKSSLEKLDKLNKEEKWFELKAEFDGTAHLAEFSAGKWVSKYKDGLSEDSKITNGTTLITVIGKNLDEASVYIPEKDKIIIDEGYTAVISLNGRRYLLEEKSRDMTVRNSQLKVTFKLPDFDKYFGMPLNVQIFRKVTEKAVYIPLTSLRYKKEDPAKAFVKIKVGEEKKDVYPELGETIGNKVLVLSELKAGDTVVLP